MERKVRQAVMASGGSVEKSVAGMEMVISCSCSLVAADEVESGEGEFSGSGTVVGLR